MTNPTTPAMSEVAVSGLVAAIQGAMPRLDGHNRGGMVYAWGRNECRTHVLEAIADYLNK